MTCPPGGGVAIHSKAPIQQGEQFGLTFERGEVRLNFVAEAVYCTDKDRTCALVRVGMKMLAMDDVAHVAWARLLAS